MPMISAIPVRQPADIPVEGKPADIPVRQAPDVPLRPS